MVVQMSGCGSTYAPQGIALRCGDGHDDDGGRAKNDQDHDNGADAALISGSVHAFNDGLVAQQGQSPAG